MIILYGAPASVFVRKPRILLEEKQILFQVDPINLYEYVNDNFKQASPLNKIPVLQDEDYFLADSSAICAYIDKKYPAPSFYPDDPKELGKALWYEEYADTVLLQAIAPSRQVFFFGNKRNNTGDPASTLKTTSSESNLNASWRKR